MYIVSSIVLFGPLYLATCGVIKLCAILFIADPKLLVTLSRSSTFYLLYGTNISWNWTQYHTKYIMSNTNTNALYLASRKSWRSIMRVIFIGKDSQPVNLPKMSSREQSFLEEIS